MDKLTKDDVKTLNFLYKRLENLHNENPNYDYMLALKKIIGKVEDVVKEEKYFTKFKKHSKKLEEQLKDLKIQLEQKL